MGVPGPLEDAVEAIRRESLSLGIPAIDPEDGMVLQALAFHIAVSGGVTIVDAGAGIGYSTAWMALGLENGCKSRCRIIAIEYDPDKASRIRLNLDRLGLDMVEVTVHVGEALEVLRSIGRVDMAFIDIEKHQYPEALEVLKRVLKVGGLAAFHNAFFPPPPHTFFEMVSRSPWRYTIIPTPAGLLVASLQ